MCAGMTTADACEVLGISTNATSKDARRAYLKLIKRHKPEQDPEGFQRVRTAFETVFGPFQARERAAAFAVNAGPEQAVLSEPATLEVNAPGKIEIQPTIQAAASFEAASDPKAAPQSELEDEAEIDEDDDVDPDELIAEWVEEVQAGDWAKAVPKIITSLERATHSPTETSLPGDLIVFAISQLAASGDCIRARDVTQRVRQWLKVLASSRDAFSQGAQLRWVLLDELVRVETRIDYSTYQVLGQAIAADQDNATRLVQRHQIIKTTQARRDAEALVARAPTLAQAFGPLLDPAPPPAPTPRRSWGWWVAIFAIFQLVRLVGTTAESRRSTPRYEVPTPIVPARAAAYVPQPSTVDSSRVEEVGYELSNRMSGHGDGLPVEEAVQALLFGECDHAGTALAELTRLAEPLGVEARGEVKLLWAEFAGKCPGQLKLYEP